MNMLDRSHWVLLATLGDTGSITQAASVLSITQSAASQRLSEAERRLGVKLATKQGRAMVLTEAGESIAAAARSAAPLLQAAESDAIWQGKRSLNRVRLAWSHFDPPGLASLLLDLGRDMQPRVDLEFVRAPGDRLASALGSDVTDLMLLPGTIKSPSVESLGLFEDRLVAVVSADSPLVSRASLTPEAFQAGRFLTYGLRPEPGWEYDLFFERGTRFPTEVARAESTELICRLVALGEGISILPAFCVAMSAFAPQLAMVELDVPPITFEWRAHYMGQSALSGSHTERLIHRLLEDIATRPGYYRRAS